jgi:hypothetical protein
MEPKKLKTRVAIGSTMLGILLITIGLYFYKYSVVMSETIPGYATSYWLKYPYIGLGIFVMILGGSFILASVSYLLIARMKQWSHTTKTG